MREIQHLHSLKSFPCRCVPCRVRPCGGFGHVAGSDLGFGWLRLGRLSIARGKKSLNFMLINGATVALTDGKACVYGLRIGPQGRWTPLAQQVSRVLTEPESSFKHKTYVPDLTEYLMEVLTEPGYSFTDPFAFSLQRQLCPGCILRVHCCSLLFVRLPVVRWTAVRPSTLSSGSRDTRQTSIGVQLASTTVFGCSS